MLEPFKFLRMITLLAQNLIIHINHRTLDPFLPLLKLDHILSQLLPKPLKLPGTLLFLRLIFISHIFQLVFYYLECLSLLFLISLKLTNRQFYIVSEF